MDLTLKHDTKKQIRKKGVLYELKKNHALFLMMLPALLVMLVHNYLPMAGIILAFKRLDNYGNIFGAEWIGFENFRYLFSSRQAFIITRNTLLYNMTFITIGSTVAVVFAIAINELRNKRLSKVYQSIFFLPYFLSWVVVSYLLFSLLSSDAGMLNKLLESLGLSGASWYTMPKFWPGILIAVNTWKWTGYDAIIYLATIVGINKVYYEAASVDGATRMQQIRFITIPLLKPLIITLTLIKIGRIFYTDMGLFFTVPRNMGILFNVTNTVDTYVYRALLQTGDLGMAAAAGFYQAVLGFVIVLSANLIIRRISKENALL